MTIRYIDTESALNTLCQQLAKATWIAVDTEFLREKTYQPQLCLIQLATPELIACVDPLPIQNLTPLLDIFYRPDITLVFHAARQDLELLYQLRHALPCAVFDTQLAATVLGYGDQVGYGNLVQQCLHVQLNKAHSRTDWTQRPLDPAQIDYAADDVRYLRELYLFLHQQLQEKNRLHWLEEDFARLTDVKEYQVDLEQMWRKVKGFGRLRGIQLAILQRLAAWREQRAIDTNRPRRWILKDEVLLELAKLAPQTLEQLHKIRGLEAPAIKRIGHDLLTEIRQARTLPESQWPKVQSITPLTPQQTIVADVLMALLKKYCEDQAISPAAVCGRKDIERLLRGDHDISLLRGWRYEVAGHHLNAFIDGRISLTADTSQLYIQEG